MRAHVIGTGRGRARSVAMDMGAERFVDLEDGEWADAVGQVDLVFDTIGGDVLERSLPMVRTGSPGVPHSPESRCRAAPGPA
jgi:NADPH:quinone reductase-like Zn-dependent oxidoreductase